MAEKLLVIGEVPVDPVRAQTGNPSLNTLLKAYRQHFTEVSYIGPGLDKALVTRLPGVAGEIFLSTVGGYSRRLVDRARFWLRSRAVRQRIRELIAASDPTVVQLRIPSVFTMAAFPVVCEQELLLTAYVAGDWVSAFGANHKFFGARLVARLLEQLQLPIIERAVTVTAGPVLARKYARFGRCHAYFSTTHQEVYPRKVRFPPRRLLFVGRLEPLKRVADAIEAVAILAAQGEPVELLVVGQGPCQRDLEELARRRNVADKVTFAGRILNQDKLHRHYLEADLLLLPSVSEGTPKVLPEAMARGVVPIACAGVGSNDFIITHGKNGFLVPSRSPGALAQTIATLRRSPGSTEQAAALAYEYAREHTLDHEVARLWRFVKQEAC